MSSIKDFMDSVSRYATWWKYIILAFIGAKRQDSYRYAPYRETIDPPTRH